MRFRPKQPCCAFLDRIVTAKETSSDTKGEAHSKRRSYLVQNSRFDPVLDSSDLIANRGIKLADNITIQTYGDFGDRR